MRRLPTLIIIPTVILCFIASKDLFSQDKWWKDKKYKSESLRIKYDLCKKTFVDIGSGLSYRNVNSISSYFDSQVYLNIIGNEKGYYSHGQAELILQNFMDYFTVENFKYTRSSRFNTYSFANGIYSYLVGSGKKSLKVAVSLKYTGDTWLVDQISIN